MMYVYLRNLNQGKRNPRIPICVSGHRPAKGEQDTFRSIWISFNLGILRGGLHTSIESAKDLRDTLDRAIQVAESEDILGLAYHHYPK